MLLTIVRAEPSQAEELTEISYAAKAFWNYPESWLRLWRERGDLVITATSIAENPTFVAIHDHSCVGFYTLILREDKTLLENLFVRPAYIGQGLGKQLFEHAVATARELEVKWLELESDPNAKEFYEKMGMTQISEKKSDLLGVERHLPIMELRL